MTETNWAGSYTYRAVALHRPTTYEQLREIVVGAARVRVLGSRHSFTDIADSEELVVLDRLPADVSVDRAAGTVSVPAALTYGTLAKLLDREGLALPALASLPHISVAGAIATATHGSGDATANLATAVAGLRLVTSTGAVVTASRGDADFDGLVVGLGATGAVTRVVLDVVPTYRMRQRVFEGLPWPTLYERLDEIMAAGDSVSVFTRWGPTVDHVLVKTRATDAPERVRAELFGAVPATVRRHPVVGHDPVNVTEQLGLPGPWWDRLPHFRMGHTPSTGEEIQSEFHVARRHAVAAIDALRGVERAMAPCLLVAELRTVAADRLWMSPQYGQDTLGVHVTWKRDVAGVARALEAVEAALAPFAPRPHWGKMFLAEGSAVVSRYERFRDFTALLQRLDPRGAFRNDWLERTLGLPVGRAPVSW